MKKNIIISFFIIFLFLGGGLLTTFSVALAFSEQENQTTIPPLTTSTPSPTTENELNESTDGQPTPIQQPVEQTITSIPPIEVTATNTVTEDKPDTSLATSNQKKNPGDQLEKPVSPLKDIPLSELKTILSQPYKQSVIQGLDSGHPGIDLAYYASPLDHRETKGILGAEIQAIYSGKVVLNITNRRPYGNFIIIETSLATVESDLIPTSSISLLTKNQIGLICPDFQEFAARATQSEKSLYILYAHLLDPSVYSVDTMVEQGQVIGQVGNSGASGGPHLHLEIRQGPAQQNFPVMAHYDNSATADEMSNYCYWRVSGYFTALDPLLIFKNNLPQ